MSTIIQTDSCGSGSPLSQFDENGTPSVINYNLPQAITYNAYSYLDLELEADQFNPDLPYDDFWERTENLTLQEIIQQLLDEIDHATNSSFFENSHLLYRLGVITRGPKRLLDYYLVNNFTQEGTETITVSAASSQDTSKTATKGLSIDGDGGNFDPTDFFGPNELIISPDGGSGSGGIGSTGGTGSTGGAGSTNTNTTDTGSAANTNNVTPQNLLWQFGDINFGDLSFDIPSLFVLRYYHVARVPLFEIAAKIKRGFKPVLVENAFGLVSLEFSAQPEDVTPTIELVLNFKMANFLGNYGAGKTINTMSLLPGETTNISIRNWQRNEITKKRAENILDSFSESSIDDLQSIIENENMRASSASRSETHSRRKRKRGGINLGVVKFGGRSSSSSNKSFNSATASQVRNLSNSTSKQSSKTDALREIQVNIETTETVQTETEQTIVRELQNINQSRVLNFSFRQLLQEYISVTYLDQVSILFTNGNDEIEAKLEDMDILLEEVLTPAALSEVRHEIIAYLCNVKDYQANTIQFVEKVNETYNNLIESGGTPINVEYIRKRQDLEMQYQGHSVNGIIFDVTHRSIRTDALIAEALLGQGETLDCYNIKLQNEAVREAIINNNEREQAIRIIDLIEDPETKAELYKKVFGDCCDVPQNIIAGSTSSNGTNTVDIPSDFGTIQQLTAQDNTNSFSFLIGSQDQGFPIMSKSIFASQEEAKAVMQNVVDIITGNETKLAESADKNMTISKPKGFVINQKDKSEAFYLAVIDEKSNEIALSISDFKSEKDAEAAKEKAISIVLNMIPKK